MVFLIVRTFFCVIGSFFDLFLLNTRHQGYTTRSKAKFELAWRESFRACSSCKQQHYRRAQNIHPSVYPSAKIPPLPRRPREASEHPVVCSCLHLLSSLQSFLFAPLRHHFPVRVSIIHMVGRDDNVMPHAILSIDISPTDVGGWARYSKN